MDTPIHITRETEFYQGYIKFKMSVSNESPYVINDITLEFIYDENLLYIAEHDDIQVKNEKFMLGNIYGGKSRTLTILFEPLTCAGAADIKCHLMYTDHEGRMASTFMEPKEISVICPLLKTDCAINIGRLKEFIKDLPCKDSRVYEVKSSFDVKNLAILAREVVEKRDVRHIRTLHTRDGKTCEIWYYGRTKIDKHNIVIKISINATDNSLELFAATQTAEALTGLLADVGRELRQTLESRAGGRGKVVNVHIKGSFVQHSNLLDMCDMDGTCDLNVIIEDSVIQHSSIAYVDEEARLKRERREQEEMKWQRREEEAALLKAAEEAGKKKKEEEERRRRKEEIKAYEAAEEAERVRMEQERKRRDEEEKARLKQEKEEQEKSRGREVANGVQAIADARKEMNKIIFNRLDKNKPLTHEEVHKIYEPSKPIEKGIRLVRGDLEKRRQEEQQKNENEKSRKEKLEEAKKKTFQKQIVFSVFIILFLGGLWLELPLITDNSSFIPKNSTQVTNMQITDNSFTTPKASTQSTNVQKSYFQQIEYNYSMDEYTAWKNENYNSIEIFGKKYACLNPDSKNELTEYVLDTEEKFTLKTGQILDLGEGYTLTPKQIDLDGNKVWLEFDKDGIYLDDKGVIIDPLNPDKSTWNYKDDVGGEDHVVIMRVHVSEVFQDQTEILVCIEGLWLIDSENAFTIKPGNELNGYEIVEITDNYISYM